MLKAAASLIVASTLVVSAISPVAGLEDGGRIELEDPIRVVDTRVGSRVTARVLGSGVLNVWVLDPVGPGTATVHPCGATPPADETTFRLTSSQDTKYARFATSESTCLTSTVPLHVIVDQEGTVAPAPSATGEQYVALSTPETLWSEASTEPQQTIRIPHPERLSDGATAAVISLDAIAASGPGFLTAHSCDRPRPRASDVAYRTDRAANIAIVPLEAGADLCVYVFRPVHVRVKLLGELAPTGPDTTALPPSWRYQPGDFPAPSLRSIVPERVLDTRIGQGRPGTSKVEPNEVVELSFGALVGPQTTAVVLNVTLTETEKAGFVTAWPCGGDRPTVSNLNFVAGETVPNLVVSKLSPGGTICLSGIARAHLIADLNGTYESDGGLLANPVRPTRILDTREALGVPTTTKLAAGQVLELDVVDGETVPERAGAVTVNVTATEPIDRGFVTVFPCDQQRPTASNLNYAAGQSVANLVTAKLSSSGTLCFYSRVDTHLIADVAAWYGVEEPAGLVDLEPKRLLDTREAVGIPTTTKIEAGQFVELDVAGRGGVGSNALAAVLNLTVTQPEARGFLTAWPCDESRPTVSNVNYAAGETNPNLATVKLSADGKVCLYTLRRAHIVADVAGYLTDEPIDTVGLALS